MDGKRVVVTLHTFSLADSFPYRSLTFTSDKDHVEIGRASKREAKNLTPTEKNGLFDSRVMSRNHAKMWACLDKKVVYICDDGSMHGTRVNGRKLDVDDEAPIKTGDLLVFGTEVTRGHETFPPLSVRCECQWFGFEENKAAPSSKVNKTKVATNTFCVPDDDDDDDDDDNDIEITGQPAPVISTVESSSDSEDDSEDGSVVEVLSPLTSSLKEIDGGVKGGSQQMPIEIDGEQNGQPLATPRMTPSSNEGALAEADGEARDQPDDSGDSELDSMLDYSEGDLASQSEDDESGSDEDSMSDSSFESDIELSDADGLSLTVPIPPFPENRKPAQADASSGDKENAGTHSNRQRFTVPGIGRDATAELPADHPVDDNIELPGIRGDAMNPNPQNLLEPEVMLAEPPGKPAPGVWSSSQQLYANAHLPLQPYGRIFDHSLTGFHSNSFGRAVEGWPSRGNPTSQYGQLRNEQIGPELVLNDTLTPCPRYYDGPFAHSAPTVPGRLPVPGISRTNTVIPAVFAKEDISNNSGSEGISTHSRPDTRLRIADIVSSPQPPTQKAPRKRKIADVENSPLDVPHLLLHNSSAFEYNASNENSLVGIEREETCLPDAQPQLDMNGTVDPCTQLTTMSQANEANSIEDLTHSEPQDERPSKRLKKSEASNIGSHATTAVVGAMIGAVGTVALLASLPSDYFI
ncbi:hypothetical protein P170DRAFT_469249 [Aspergillus steynii IBT 23096]|uniref:FHA domain-containing protein n=1 Tax=Aspergillus steynii IBT 23096 TaxID=1392250 RepID=A0A2I2GLL1_9EURO|nr:uncharacterized protein P170DRAFT_469249 [Aspergillus steynii IBT 23096]PLB53761.1 hypothetical protein P170DRAFT_469249 [Aspergillus steynii IBT 23096]